MPYAKAHNEGFKGTISVKAHSRNQYRKTQIGTGKFTKSGRERQKTVSIKSGESRVKAHTRRINLPQRPFIPTKNNPSPVLEKAINRELYKNLLKIITQ